MYSQLLYLIIALLLFTIQQPGSKPFLPLPETLILGMGVFFCYVFACYMAFSRLGQYALRQDLSPSFLSLRYHRTETKLSILALGTLAVYVYVLNIKFYLRNIPCFDQCLTLSGIVALGFYMLHLGVIWYLSYPIHRHIYHSAISRPAYIKGHFTFSSAILIPWLVITFISDLLQLLKTPAFLNTDTGQFLLLGMVLLLFILFAPWLVVRLWGCQTLPEGPVRTELEEFCRSHGFRIGDFMLWPLFGGEMLTAGVMGLLPRCRYILITKGLLSMLDVEELKAVVGHEMGHVRRLHLVFYLFFFLCYSLLTYSFNDIILLFLLKYGIFIEWASARDTLHMTLFSLVYSIPVLVLLIVYFRYIFGFFLRNSERQADLYSLQLVGHPYTLVSSLEKIAIYSGHIGDLPSWHHYSIRQRVDFVMEAFRNPAVIRRHHLKLYGSTLLFMAVVATLMTASLQLKGTRIVQQWRIEQEVGIVERQLRLQPGNPQLYGAYGGLLLELGRFEKAEAALRKALEITPEDPGIMNNLAWLYATSPPPYFDAENALRLALQASGINPEAHILDTLAEAYYVNGRFDEAVETIDKALEQEPENRDYFLQQKQKFEKAKTPAGHPA